MSDSIVEEEDVFFPGDLLWAKIGQYPFWPCMVTYAPGTGAHKRKTAKTGGLHWSYHVQYFGEGATRGWTPYGTSSSFPFEGEKTYYKRVEKLKSQSKNVEKYKVQELHKIKWQIAVKEAEEALLLQNRRTRFESYVFRFEKPKTSDDTDLPKDLDSTLDTSEPSSSKKIRLSTDSPSICDACQELNVEFSCSELCGRFFHLNCYGLLNMPKGFKCIDCLSVCSKSSSHQDNLLTGVSSKSSPLCFKCKFKYNDDKVIKCGLFKCLNYYHLSCLSKFECAIPEKKICPQHTCYTCYREDANNILARKGPLVRCLQCPYAFHSQENCVPPGAVLVSELETICPLHFGGEKKVSPKTTCNNDTCSVCHSGGVLICCETCPNALHKECIPPIFPVTSEDFMCPDCYNRQYLQNGMIVWSRAVRGLGQRWWPAKIIYPSELPESIKEKTHHGGEFVVKYYGLSTYSWTHNGRVFEYTEEHLSLEEELINETDKQFIKGFKEAAKAFKVTIQNKFSGMSPEPYKHIKVNRALPPAQIIKTNLPSCTCDATTPNPCGPESQCLNRSMMMECSPDMCKAKDLCENQQFQKREYASTKIIKTNNRGWGLAAVNAVKKGEFIIEYIGEIITHTEYYKRSQELLEKGKENYYFLYLDAKRMIDAGPMGNLSRFINHSCEPNCKMAKWSINGDLRVGIFAVEDISPGEELTFDYQSEKFSFEQQCFCGATKCKKFIGGKSFTPSSPVPIKAIKNKKGSKKSCSKDLPFSKEIKLFFKLHNTFQPRVAVTKISKDCVVAACARAENAPKESDIIKRCFICQKPGSLITCGERGCIRAYHLQCLGLAEAPTGEWICAVHNCSRCGKPAHIFCEFCPISVCEECWTLGDIEERFICQFCLVKYEKTT